MAFYDSANTNTNASASTSTSTSAHLPHLAPQGDLTISQDAPEVSLNFTEAQVEEYKEQDRFLPIANVARIMKNSLPGSAKVSKEAKECVQECVSEFISFITSEAADKCFQEKRKTIGGEDILTSMQALGFDNYAGVMKVYLSKYRVHQANLLGNQDEEDGDDEGGVGKKKKRKDAKKRKRESGGDEPVV